MWNGARDNLAPACTLASCLLTGARQRRLSFAAQARSARPFFLLRAEQQSIPNNGRCGRSCCCSLLGWWRRACTTHRAAILRTTAASQRPTRVKGVLLHSLSCGSSWPLRVWGQSETVKATTPPSWLQAASSSSSSTAPCHGLEGASGPAPEITKYISAFHGHAICSPSSETLGRCASMHRDRGPGWPFPEPLCTILTPAST